MWLETMLGALRAHIDQLLLDCLLFGRECEHVLAEPVTESWSAQQWLQCESGMSAGCCHTKLLVSCLGCNHGQFHTDLPSCRSSFWLSAFGADLEHCRLDRQHTHIMLLWQANTSSTQSSNVMPRDLREGRWKTGSPAHVREWRNHDGPQTRKHGDA